jgi:hypothetical protein
MSIMGPINAEEFWRRQKIDVERLKARVGRRVPPLSGATTARPDPATVWVGLQFFDTTLGKPVWSNGTAWVDATGAPA